MPCLFPALRPPWLAGFRVMQVGGLQGRRGAVAVARAIATASRGVLGK